MLALPSLLAEDFGTRLSVNFEFATIPVPLLQLVIK